MSSDKQMEIAKKFGDLLDEDDFINFESMLDERCIYEIGGQVLKGKKSIAGLYEKNMKEGKSKFDQLIWGESEVKAIGGGRYDVYFSDFLMHRGLEHNYKCKQRITINKDDKVEKIEHMELPGEREALDQFYQQIGFK